jgi:N-acetylglucosaminyl-diphospho-decaprenol L-rhamnosyltransferase
MNICDKITIIIVSYNSEKLISKNIEILKKFPTIIVDNSKSNKLNHIIKEYKNIKLIIPDKNLGYGKGNNLGVTYSSTQFILIANPDVILDEKSILELYMAFLENIENAGILGPSLYDPKMIRRTNGSISYIKKTQGQKLLNSVNNLPEANISCEFLVGCCFLMKRDFFNQLGGFDKNFFMYFEDNDLCDRVIQNGKIIMEIPSAKIIHLENSSSNKNFLHNTKMALIHKISSYIYLKKNLSKSELFFNLTKNFFDYFQRSFFNIIFFKPKKSFKNILRILSIILFVTYFYKLLY